MKMNNRKIKVAYFAGSLQPGHDGVTRVLYKLIDNLKKYNIESMFFSPIIPGKEEQPVQMYSVPSFTFPLYKEYKFAVPGQRYFEDKLKEFQPDIIHINSPCSLGYAAVKYGNRNGIPVAATYHTHFASYAKYYKIKAFENISWSYFRKIYNACRIVYVPSKPILDELKLHDIHNLKYLPHGVDNETFNTSFYSQEWKRKNNIGGKKAVLFVGRLVWEKDLETLANSYKIIMDTRDDAAFVIVGDGPIKNELIKLMPKAVFLGYQSGTKLAEAYASSDIFVFPSTTETFGNVTLEAMASGLPPICAKEGGAYGVIDEGINGLTAIPRDPVDLAKKINLLLDYDEKRNYLRNNAINYAKEQTWDKIFQKLVNSYQLLISDYKSEMYKKIKAA
ncbi:MAG: glycosyltransferase family 1 protein [Ignavibacteriaceae bacterium]